VTLRRRILEYLLEHPGKSATQTAQALSWNVSSVASLLKQMFDRGEVTRTPAEGPRGGFGYRAASMMFDNVPAVPEGPATPEKLCAWPMCPALRKEGSEYCAGHRTS
jgi:hypothetical protein